VCHGSWRTILDLVHYTDSRSLRMGVPTFNYRIFDHSCVLPNETPKERFLGNRCEAGASYALQILVTVLKERVPEGIGGPCRKGGNGAGLSAFGDINKLLRQAVANPFFPTC